jgi:hypothetical protein
MKFPSPEKKFELCIWNCICLFTRNNWVDYYSLSLFVVQFDCDFSHVLMLHLILCCPLVDL